MKTRPTYGAALMWIAQNDASGDNEQPEDIASYISVCLVADLFGKLQGDVARDVYDTRHGKPCVSTFRVLMAALKVQGFSDGEARAAIAKGIR
jgi:hypothetical protein